MRRRRAVILIGSVGLVLAVASIVFEPARDGLDSWRAERAWPHDKVAVTAAMGRVSLPAAYSPVACGAIGDLPPADRCWSTRLMPQQALPDLRAAVEATGVELLEDTIAAPDTPDGPAATNVITRVPGTYRGQGFALVASRDVDLQAAARDGIWLDTTTVTLRPALTAP